MTGKKKNILTVKNIRNINMENILHSILRGKSVTRNTLAKENDISLMTVKHIVDCLIENHILIEKESSNADVGRNPKVLELAECYGNIVCVNLASRDELRYLIYDIYRNQMDAQRIPMTGASVYQEELRRLTDMIQKSLQSLSTKNVGIAVFVPSAYDESADLIHYDLIPEFKDFHIKALFKESFDTENICILHDVSAAAQSEYDSLDPKHESQFYFYCGYGVGGYFIYKGEAVTGEQNMAGEVGKILVSEHTTLEEVISISAVKKRMKAYGMDMPFAELLELYDSKDKKAAEVLTPVLDTICRALYNLLWVYNPTRVVIDSSKDKYSEVIARRFREFTERMTDEAIPIHVQVRKAKYDEYHMMRGCFQACRNAWIEKIAERLQ